MQLTHLAPVAVLALLAPRALARASDPSTDLYARDADFSDADEAFLYTRDAEPDYDYESAALQQLLSRSLEAVHDLRNVLMRQGQVISMIEGKCIHTWQTMPSGKEKWCTKCGKGGRVM